MDGFLRDFFENGPTSPNGEWREPYNNYPTPPRDDLRLANVLQEIQGYRNSLKAEIVVDPGFSRRVNDLSEMEPGEEYLEMITEYGKIGSHTESYIVDRGGGDTYPMYDEVDDYGSIAIGYFVGRKKITKPDVKKRDEAKKGLTRLLENPEEVHLFHSANYLFNWALFEAGLKPDHNERSSIEGLNKGLVELAKNNLDYCDVTRADLNVIYGIPNTTRTEGYHRNSRDTMSGIRMEAGKLLGETEANILGREHGEFMKFLNHEELLKVYWKSSIKKYRRDAFDHLPFRETNPATYTILKTIQIGSLFALPAGIGYALSLIFK